METQTSATAETPKDEDKVIVSDPSNYVRYYGSGYFAIFTRASDKKSFILSSIRSCREEFERYCINPGSWTSNKFCAVGYTQQCSPDHKAAFETLAGIGERLGHPLIFRETTLGGVFFCQPDPWWLMSHLNRGMMTLLIRMAFMHGKSSKPEDVQKSLMNYSLASMIAPHVNAFVNGNTSLAMEDDPEAAIAMQGGIVNFFKNKPSKLVKLYTNAA